MKLIRTFIIFASLLFSTNANAALLGTWNDVGPLNVGNNGSFINYYTGDNYVSEGLSGSLASKSVLTIDYTLTDAIATSIDASAYRLFSLLSYAGDYDDGSGYDYSYSGTNNPLLITVAKVFDPNHGSVIISNMTSETVRFASLISSQMCGSCASILTEYNVTSVPLPAALPLFGLGVAALAGAGIRRKKVGA